MIQWQFNWKREYSFVYGMAVLYSFRDFIKEDININSYALGEAIDGWFYTYSEKGLLEKVDKEHIMCLKKNIKKVKRWIKQLQKDGDKFVNFTKQIKVSAKTNNKKLLSIYRKFFELFVEYTVHLWRIFYLVENASKIFEEVIFTEVLQHEVNDAIKHYSKPSQKAALLRLNEYFSKVKDIKRREEYVKRNVPWLGSSDPYQKPLDHKQIMEIIKSYKASVKTPERFTKELKNKKFVKVYQDMLYLKDKRDEYRREAFYHVYPFLKEISRRLKISVTDLSYLLPNEIFSKDIKKKIKERKQGCIIEVKKRTKIIAGRQTLGKFLSKKKEKIVKSFTGIIGSPGLVKGKVQIIKSVDDIQNFNKGNILVTNTTNPEYISAMQKAIAFVTDEGGITSHAAIVAREFNKPCVAGTKIATKVLKDGDLVEVDANKGVVRKIK